MHKIKHNVRRVIDVKNEDIWIYNATNKISKLPKENLYEIIEFKKILYSKSTYNQIIKFLKSNR